MSDSLSVAGFAGKSDIRSSDNESRRWVGCGRLDQEVADRGAHWATASPTKLLSPPGDGAERA
jgi:hypothetical protein